MWDVFISHASEDKEEIARPLAEELEQRGFRVWYDDLTLEMGDNLRPSIDKGLKESRYGIVILSPSFFAKEWAIRELDALMIRESNGVKVILPVWHKIAREEIEGHSLMLAGRIGMNASKGITALVDDIERVIRGSKPMYGLSREEPGKRLQKGNFVKENFILFYSILPAPVRFIQSIKHSSQEELIKSSIFAALMSFLSLVIQSPLLQLLGVETRTVPFVLVDTTLTYSVWFIMGICYHISAKLFRGSGTYVSSLTTYLYMKAFTPLIILVGIPWHDLLRSVVLESGNENGLFIFISTVPRVIESSTVLISFLLFEVIVFYRTVCLFRSFCFIHGVSKYRGIAIIILGILLESLAEAAISIPANRILWKAYQSL